MAKTHQFPMDTVKTMQIKVTVANDQKYQFPTGTVKTRKPRMPARKPTRSINSLWER